MVEIDIKDKISMDVVHTTEMDDLENLINNTIRDALISKMTEALDKMAYIDLEPNEEDHVFEIEASLVLCSKQDIATNAQRQAALMSEYGLEPDQIEEILMIQIEDNGGF